MRERQGFLSWEGMAVEVDVVIVGAGIVGLATAHQLVTERPGLSVRVLEKEPRPAAHQTGHNSGVIHSGLYYTPGSHKATMVAHGRKLLTDFCDERGIPYDLCGKVVVATEPDQHDRLEALAQRGLENGLPIEVIGRERLLELEPNVRGDRAIHVPIAGIVDYKAVCRELVGAIREAGGIVEADWPVEAISATGDSVTVSGPAGSATGRVLVNCAGLHSDRVAALAGADTGGVRIMPFRGEYYELAPHRRSLVNDLIYPLPDPAFPFLGVHLTRMIDGSIHAGPNAVPALRREGYRWRDVSLRDLGEVLGSGRTYRLARKYWRTGAGEVWRSLNRRAFLTALQGLVPELTADDLEPSPAGVRAQAIDRHGNLLDDFSITRSARAVHVVNAPSPAATASLAIGEHIAGLTLTELDT